MTIEFRKSITFNRNDEYTKSRPGLVINFRIFGRSHWLWITTHNYQHLGV